MYSNVILQVFHKQNRDWNLLTFVVQAYQQKSLRKQVSQVYCLSTHVITSWLSDQGEKENPCFFPVLVFSPLICNLLSPAISGHHVI